MTELLVAFWLDDRILYVRLTSVVDVLKVRRIKANRYSVLTPIGPGNRALYSALHATIDETLSRPPGEAK